VEFRLKQRLSHNAKGGKRASFKEQVAEKGRGMVITVMHLPTSKRKEKGTGNQIPLKVSW